MYCRLQNSGIGAAGANSNTQGFYVCNRSGASAWQAYKNGSSIGTGTDTNSAGFDNSDYAFPDHSAPSTDLIMAGGFGGSLSSMDQSNLCHELNLYLTSIAGVSSGVC